MNQIYYEQLEKERDKAIARGWNAAADDWKFAALEVLMKYCFYRRDDFSTNDFRPLVEALEEKTHDKRAMGGLMRCAQRLGWCELTGKYTLGTDSNLSPISVWRSKIYFEKDQKLFP